MVRSEASHERQLLYNRMRNRTRRHGNFRQTLIDCAFQCVRCAETAELEFHAPDGDDGHEGWQGNGHAPDSAKRVTLCSHCHSTWGHFEQGEQARFIGMHLLDQSMLIEDVLAEVNKWGGFEKWLHFFKLDKSRLGVELPEVDMFGEESKAARIRFAMDVIGGVNVNS